MEDISQSKAIAGPEMCGGCVNTLDAVLDVLGYEIALLRRTRQGQRMRDCARSRLPPLLAKAAAAGR